MASKSTSIKVGDTVRINEAYGRLWGNAAWDRIGRNNVGVEFVVTDVKAGRTDGRDTFYVKGDPMGRGIWAKYVEPVKSRRVKAHTTTIIKARETWLRKDRVVSITSGNAAISMTIAEDPTPYPFESDGRTTLTPDQAEKIANDILERVAEIRAHEEAGV